MCAAACRATHPEEARASPTVRGDAQITVADGSGLARLDVARRRHGYYESCRYARALPRGDITAGVLLKQRAFASVATPVEGSPHSVTIRWEYLPRAQFHALRWSTSHAYSQVLRTLGVGHLWPACCGRRAWWRRGGGREEHYHDVKCV